jgi:hypothetical protein
MAAYSIYLVMRRRFRRESRSVLSVLGEIDQVNFFVGAFDT